MSAMATDPVCGMAVDRADAPHLRDEGQTYFFCSTACRKEFAVAPERFLERRADGPSSPPRMTVIGLDP